MSNLKKFIRRRFDGVLIAGGGVAGCAAAIGAARAGAPVLVLENGISLGGMASSGLLPLWMDGSDSPLRRELDSRCAQCSAGPVERDRGLDHECMKLVLEKWFDELGITYCYNSSVIDAKTASGSVIGVYAAMPEGLVEISAPLLIDATGDGALAAAAGVEFTLGRDSDHACQGASLAFEVGGVNLPDGSLPDSFDVPFATPHGNAAELARRELTPPAGHLILHRTSVRGVISANMTNAVGFDPTSGSGRTDAIRLCRRQIEEIVMFLRRFMPGFEKCYLRLSGSEFGIRESRHFHGRHTLTEQEILTGAVFDDWIATRNHFPFDIHNVAGCGLDDNGVLDGFPPDRTYTVPLRSCLPENGTGLLLAGRNISGTHVAHSSFRVMPICLNIGLGVGIAAAVAWKHQTLPELADIEMIQREIIRQGVIPPNR